MKNNDILRRIRFVFNLDDSKMMKLCSTKETKVSRAEISDWLKRDDDIGHKELEDVELAIFLNSFIEEKRGKRDGPAPEPEKRLSNNAVFMKLKIALNLKAEDVLDILSVAGFKLGKHELSAFFRKPGHKHFRECKDQVLRNFLQGLQDKYRKDVIAKPKVETENKPETKPKSNANAVSPAPPVGGYQWKKKPESD
ncbi:MAG: DUF1456 family protein [Cocleimonas sp.]